MFQNDKTAIYEFIFIDHIVFIFMDGKESWKPRHCNGDFHALRLTSLDLRKVH